MWGEEPDIKWLLHLVSMTIMIITKSMEQTGYFCYPGSLTKQKKISTGLKFQAQRTSGVLSNSVVTLKKTLLSSNYRADKPEDQAQNMIVQVAELLHCINTQHHHSCYDKARTLVEKLDSEVQDEHICIDPFEGVNFNSSNDPEILVYEEVACLPLYEKNNLFIHKDLSIWVFASQWDISLS